MRPPSDILTSLKSTPELGLRIGILANKISGLYTEPRPVLKEIELANIYWEALELLVKTKISDPMFPISGWTTDERVFIDGGIAPAGKVEYEERAAVIEKAEPFAESPEVATHFLSSYLALKIRKIIGADGSSGEAAKLEKQIAEHEIRLKEIRHKRAKFYDGGKNPNLVKAAAREFDEELLEFCVKAATNADCSSGLAREELNAAAEKLREAEAAEFSEPAARRGLTLMMNEIFRLSVELPKMKLIYAAAKSKARTPGESEMELAFSRADALIAGIQKAVYNCAGPKGTPAFHGKISNTPSSVQKDFSAALGIVKNLAKNLSRGEKSGMTIVILPCRGHERVDKSAMLLWLPVSESEQDASSAIRALAELSFTSSPDVASSYKAVKKLELADKSPELLEKYKTDYAAFIAEKSGGKRVLSGTVREFFDKITGAEKNESGD